VIEYAPIILFVYNRPWHTKKTIEALRKNTLASDSELFIYSDAAKNESAKEEVDEVRGYIKTITGFKKLTIIEREKNWGLADSIIDGVTAIVDIFGRIIVLEDDIVTSPYFLQFMNDALDFYQNETKVWHISGWNYPINTDGLDGVFLARMMNCWGWATWGDRWQFFEKDADKLVSTFSKEEIKAFNLDGSQDFWSQVIANKNQKMNTWAVFWYASIFKNNGLCLSPCKSFVSNIGVDGSGANCGNEDFYQMKLNDTNVFKFCSTIIENTEVVARISKFNLSIKSKSKTLTKSNHLLRIMKLPFRYLFGDLKKRKNLFKLRIKFPNSYIEKNTHIVYDDINAMYLGVNTYIGNFSTLYVMNYDANSNNSYFSLGDNSSIGELNNIRASGGRILIGKNCLISQNVSMIAAGHNIKSNCLINEQKWDEEKTGITLSDDVWVGANVVILPGVKIEKGAVIAAGSVVTKDVAEYSIVAGVPARHLKYRTDK
jgi:acetyltransferase-like isoleucine patch superfamily enzyme